MKPSLKFTEEALLDYKEAYNWYSNIEKSLGNSFEKEIKITLEKIETNSDIYPIVEGQTRRVITNRFPYGVFFLVDNNQIIITAVLHHRRNPEKWKQR